MVVSVFPVSRSAIGKERVVVTPGSLGWESNCFTTAPSDLAEMGTFLLVVEANLQVAGTYQRDFWRQRAERLEILGVFTAMFEGALGRFEACRKPRIL
jgi:hypothetical protein